MDPRTKQGFNGAGAEEPRAAGTGGVADAIDPATKAEGELATATQQRQRLNLNDPAVIAAKAAADATRILIEAEEKLTRTVEMRQKAQAGLSTGAGASRKNDLLDEAMGVPKADPHRPASEVRGGTDSKMAEALRAERELATAMQQRLQLAKALAGTPSAPTPGTAGQRGYGGAALVGGERPGVSVTEAGQARLEGKLRGGATAKGLDISDTRAGDGGGLSIHDEKRAVLDRKASADRKEQFVAGLEAKWADDAKRPGVIGASRSVMGAAGGAMPSLGEAAKHATALSQIHNEPFITEQDRFWKKAGMVPGVSSLRDFQLELQKMGSGKSEYAHRQKVFESESRDQAYRRPTEEFGSKWHMDVREAEARITANYGGFQLDDPKSPTGRSERILRPELPAGERESVSGRRRFRDESAALAPKDAEFRAKQEVYALSQRQYELDKQRERQAEEIARLEGVRTAALQRADVDANDGGFSKKEALQEAADAARGVVTHRKMLTAMDDDKRGLDERLAKAKGVERDSTRAVAGVQLDQLRERESTARGQTQRLGMMGVEGRMEAILSKQIVDQIGFENAPRDLLGTYASAFPETAAAEAQKAGQKFQPQFQQLAPEEYRDDIPTITKKVDDLTAAIRAQEQKDMGAALSNLADAVKGMFSRNQRYIDEVEALWKLFITEGALKNSR